MDLTRFHEAQRYAYQSALTEIRNGKKCSCWMWYIFPQIAGLGRSSTAQYYAIANLEEAIAYRNDDILGGRLIEISKALLELESDDAYVIFGSPDNMKLKSSMTLFALADPDQEIFQKVLDKFFHGERDRKTIQLVSKNGNTK